MANKRLIDANAMREDWIENGENEYVYDTNAVLDSIDAQPTIDAVEVVRCKDCKRFELGEDGIYYCRRDKLGNGVFMKNNDFCSYGERKSND